MSTLLEDHYIEAKAAAKLYAESEVDLVKLKVAKTATRYGGKVIAAVVILLLSCVSFAILLIALGFALADVLQNTALGFLCAGLAGFLITLIAAFTLRKVVESSIIQSVLKELYNV